MSESEALADRVLKIELAVSHLERSFEQLNETVLSHESAVRVLKAELEAMRTRVERMHPEAESRDVGEERPPHY